MSSTMLDTMHIIGCALLFNNYDHFVTWFS